MEYYNCKYYEPITEINYDYDVDDNGNVLNTYPVEELIGEFCHKKELHLDKQPFNIYSMGLSIGKPIQCVNCEYLKEQLTDKQIEQYHINQEEEFLENKEIDNYGNIRDKR